MRLLNEGWSPEGEVLVEFDGQGQGGSDIPFFTDQVQIEIGRALLPLLDPQNGAPLLDHLETLRTELAQLLGLMLPRLKVHDNLGLEENRYILRIKGAPVYSSELFLDRLFAIGSPQQLDPIEGWVTQDPVLGTRAKWIESSQKEKADAQGCTLLGPLALMMHHLRSILAQAASDLLGLQDVYDLMERLSATHPVVAEPFLESRQSLRFLQKVLRNLLDEGIPIKDLVTTSEIAGEALDRGWLPDEGSEACRKALSFLLCSRLLNEEGKLIGLALAPDWEERLADLDLSPDDPMYESVSEELSSRICQRLEEVSPQRITALITDPGTRRAVRKLTAKLLPQLSVLATDELAPSCKVLLAGSVTRESSGSRELDRVESKTSRSTLGRA